MYKTAENHEFTTVYCLGCGNKHRVIKSCGLRYCPACGHITRWRVRERLHQLFKLYTRHPHYRLKMLTLSRQNCSDLKEGLNVLIASFRKLRQTKFWRKNVRGGLFVIEITGSEANWHPHLHCFIYSDFLRWDRLLDKWNRCSRGGQSVWIENVSNDSAIYYVTKYVTKTDGDPEFGYSIESAMAGRRLFQRFGDWSRIKLPKYMSARKCPVCGKCDWISEWEYNKVASFADS